MPRCSMHAEKHALGRCDANGATIYVARNKNGNDRLSKPCSNCQKAIVSAGVKQVVYTI